MKINNHYWVLIAVILAIALIPNVQAATPNITIVKPIGEYFTNTLPYYNLSINFTTQNNTAGSCWYNITPPYLQRILSGYNGNFSYPNLKQDMPNAISDYISNWSDVLFVYVDNATTGWLYYDPTDIPFSTLPKIEYGELTAIFTISGNHFNFSYGGNLTNCQNTTFNLNKSGNYNLNLYMNDTFGNIGSKTSDFSINLLNASHSASSYNAVEGQDVNFTLQINATSITSVNATFYFNNTAYNFDTRVNSSHQANFTKVLTMPHSLYNLNFSWNYTVNSFNNITNNLSMSVSNVTMGTCDLINNFTLLNYTLFDETTLTFINGTADNSSIEVTIDMTSISLTPMLFNYSHLFNNTNPVHICTSINFSNSSAYFRLNVTARYSTDTRVTRFNNYQNVLVSNLTIPLHIQLMSLLSSLSNPFTITYKDSNYLPDPDVLINIYRNYYFGNVLVESPKTDSSGQVVGNLILNNVIYTIIATQNGQILATFPNVLAICQNPLISTCTISLNQLNSFVSQGNFNYVNGVLATMDFDEANRRITVIYSTQDNSIQTLMFNVTKLDSYQNTTICSSTQTAATGTFTCNILSSYGNITILADLYKKSNTNIYSILSNTYSFTVGKAKDIFGDEGGIWVVFLMMTIPLMFVASPILVVLGSVFGFIIAGGMLLLNGVNIITGSGIIIWVVVLAVALIIKMNHNEGGG